MKAKQHLIVIPILAIGVLISCEFLEPVAPEENELLDGPLAELTNGENSQFLAGDVAFNDEVFTVQSGLGPLFVASSCGSCHAGDGKGTPFTTLTRFGQTDATGNQFLHLGGPQLQHRAIPGFEPESIPPGATSSEFTPPAVTGLGFLQFVSDADIMALEDPNDLDGDGISGVANWIELPEFIAPLPNAIAVDGKYIHRFGKKASAYDLLHQTVNAYNQDMGVTSSFVPNDVLTGLEVDPEVSDNTIRNVVAYLQMLKAPLPRSENNPSVLNGKSIFSTIGCSGCHVPEMQTSDAPIEALSNKTFYPYTDLLLHDMGSELDDGYTEGNATTSEWRTPPLWGLGLSPLSQGGKFFLMHDGRAESIEEAIILHGGEGEASKIQFQSLSSQDKSDVLAFLNSL